MNEITTAPDRTIVNTLADAGTKSTLTLIPLGAALAASAALGHLCSLTATTAREVLEACYIYSTCARQLTEEEPTPAGHAVHALNHYIIPAAGLACAVQFACNIWKAHRATGQHPDVPKDPKLDANEDYSTENRRKFIGCADWLELVTEYLGNSKKKRESGEPYTVDCKTDCRSISRAFYKQYERTIRRMYLKNYTEDRGLGLAEQTKRAYLRAWAIPSRMINEVTVNPGWSRRECCDCYRAYPAQLVEGNVAFSQTGDRMACLIKGSPWYNGSRHTIAALWDTASGKLVCALPHPREGQIGTTAVAISPVGRTVATGDENGVIRIWNPNRWRSYSSDILTQQTSKITKIAFSSDERLVAFGCNARTVETWRLSDKKLISRAPVNSSKVHMLQFVPDSKIIALQDREGEKIELWNIETHKLLPFGALLESPTEDHAYEVAFSPNGKFAAALLKGHKYHIYEKHSSGYKPFKDAFQTGISAPTTTPSVQFSDDSFYIRNGQITFIFNTTTKRASNTTLEPIDNEIESSSSFRFRLLASRADGEAGGCSLYDTKTKSNALLFNDQTSISFSPNGELALVCARGNDYDHDHLRFIHLKQGDLPPSLVLRIEKEFGAAEQPRALSRIISRLLPSPSNT